MSSSQFSTVSASAVRPMPRITATSVPTPWATSPPSALKQATCCHCRTCAGWVCAMQPNGRAASRLSLRAPPFTGTAATGFTRTAGRHDYAVAPSGRTVLDAAADNHRAIITIGKIGDIFAHRNTGHEVKGEDTATLFTALLNATGALADGGLIFANFCDFDTLYGHRRDWQGTDHTRERVPILVTGPDLAPGFIGARQTFADIGQSVAWHLGLAPLAHGTAWQPESA